MWLRGVLFSLFVCFGLSTAQADERIHSFDVGIVVHEDGDIDVTETIVVTAEGRSINRGIYRALPRFFALDNGSRIRYGYDVDSVTRNGEREPYDIYNEGNARIIRIGDEDVFLPRGMRQTYQIRYSVKNQIRYFEDHDELYWNVTGNYWEFPIDSARAQITFPDGTRITGYDGYTGGFGTSGSDYSARQTQNGIIFQSTRGFGAEEGLTISVSIPKGVIEPPSFADKFGILWQRFVGVGLLILSFLGVGYYYFRSWQKVGRDAPRLPVFPVYHPPEGFSAPAAHYIYHRNFKGSDAFASSLVTLGMKGLLSIKTEKKTVELTKQTPESAPAMEDFERDLYDGLLGSRETREIGDSYDSGFAAVYKDFKSVISKRYGAKYFRWNTGYIVFAAILSFIAVVVAATMTIDWSGWHVALIAGLIGLNLLFMYLMPAQTRKGEEVRSEIAGLKLYMETAEKHQMNDVDIHGDAPPPMSKERYEELLPYAMALDVEKPWSQYFENVLPDEARDYNPGWGSYTYWGGHSLHAMNRSLSSSISSSVSTASVQPSSSSGSGGGGFSGGGGGGGGGGGW